MGIFLERCRHCWLLVQISYLNFSMSVFFHFSFFNFNCSFFLISGGSPLEGVSHCPREVSLTMSSPFISLLKNIIGHIPREVSSLPTFSTDSLHKFLNVCILQWIWCVGFILNNSRRGLFRVPFVWGPEWIGGRCRCHVISRTFGYVDIEVWISIMVSLDMWIIIFAW